MGPHWTVLCSLLGQLGTSLLSLGWSTQTRGHRVGVSTRGAPLVLIHLCLALRPYRCLATAAAGNKDRLSRKGEGKGSRPQTRFHLPSFPSTAAVAPPGRGGAILGRGPGLDPSEPP